MKVRLPIILINFKNYKEASGKKAVRLAKICERVSKKYNVTIAVVPHFIDIRHVIEEVDIPVFAQHLGRIEKAGASTGHIVAENLKDAGIKGSLISHSERKLTMDEVGKCVDIAKNLGLISVCCIAIPEEVEKIARFGPDFIAVEPPELISSGISVSKAKPEVVTRSVEMVQRVNPSVKVLCGAGITTGEDVKKALELGTVGVLVASGVVKAENPEAVLTDFAKSLSI